MNYLPKCQLSWCISLSYTEVVTNQWFMGCRLRRPPNRMSQYYAVIPGGEGVKKKKVSGLLNTANYHNYHNSTSFRKVKWSLMWFYVSIIEHFARMCYTAVWLNHGSRAAPIVQCVQLLHDGAAELFAWGVCGGKKKKIDRSSSSLHAARHICLLTFIVGAVWWS